MVDRLAQLGAIKALILPGLGLSPSAVSDPDYHAELPENRAPYGRVLTAIPDPGAMVVFASGGFAHGPGRAQAHLRGPFFGSGSVSSADGALLEIAAQVGAALVFGWIAGRSAASHGTD